MIKYLIKCHRNHEFESWFSDSSEFEKLNKKIIRVYILLFKKISKSIMAPMVSGTKNDEIELMISNEKLKNKDNLIKLRNYIENNFEYVGENFTKEVREVFYDKDSKRVIYGNASEEENELAEEGIDLMTIPWIEKDN